MAWAVSQTLTIGSGHGVASISTSNAGLTPNLGDAIIIFAWAEGSGLTGISLSDSKGNSYTIATNAAQLNSTSVVAVTIGYNVNIGATGNGFNCSAAPVGAGSFSGSVVAVNCTGGATVGQPDGSIGTASNTGTTATPGNLTVAANDLVLGVAAIGSVGTITITEPSGYTVAGAQSNGSSFCVGSGVYQINPASPTNPSWSFPSGFDWAASQVGLLVGGGAVPSVASWLPQFVLPVISPNHCVVTGRRLIRALPLSVGRQPRRRGAWS